MGRATEGCRCQSETPSAAGTLRPASACCGPVCAVDVKGSKKFRGLPSTAVLRRACDASSIESRRSRSSTASARAGVHVDANRRVRLTRLIWIVPTVLLVLVALVAPAAAAPDDQQWDPTLPKIISSGAPGDPVAIANASLQVSQLATQTTMELGRKFLSGLGIGGDTAMPPSAVPGRLTGVNGSQAIEYVIRRGASQTGVPYSWGGGKPNGPSLGVDSGANTVGYDCSGFTQFSFAGVGVLIPKFSGDQYNTGRKIPPSQAKRGDLIFYGPGGTQHVGIYLGNGQVLEAASSYGQVGVHPVRTAGMSPYLVRIIES